MIPIIFRRYKKAPLATCVSFMATACFAVAVICSVGYLLNWEGMRESGSLGENQLVAAVFALLGFGLWKLAAWLAERKYQKMRGDAAPAPAPKPVAGPKPAAAGVICPKCGARAEPGDAYCVQCGTKL